MMEQHSFALAENGILETFGLALETIHDATRPHKFSREQAQSEENYGSARPGSENHNHSQQKQGEPGEDQKNAANLLDRLKEH